MMKFGMAPPPHIQYPLPTDEPDDWEPEVIRCMTIKVDLDPTELRFTYYGKREWDCRRYTLQDAINEALNNPPPRPFHGTPLDLNLKRPLWMMIQLVPHMNIQFAATGDAATTKHQKTQGSYGKLVHVDGSGHEMSLPGNGCRLVYFAAKPAPVDPTTGKLDFRDGFNFNVEILMKEADRDENGHIIVDEHGDPVMIDKRLPLIIDPDIKYPGGHGA